MVISNLAGQTVQHTELSPSLAASLEGEAEEEATWQIILYPGLLCYVAAHLKSCFAWKDLQATMCIPSEDML